MTPAEVPPRFLGIDGEAHPVRLPAKGWPALTVVPLTLPRTRRSPRPEAGGIAIDENGHADVDAI